jgi:hypothetical protein
MEMSSQVEQCPWCGSTISRDKFEEIEARIRRDEKRKMAEREKEIRKEFEGKRTAELERERTKATQAQKVASQKEIDGLRSKLSTVEAREAKLRKELNEEGTTKLNDQRLLLDAEHQKALQREQAGFGRERQRWQKKIAELERQLQQKSAHELGEGAEVDLFESLTVEFSADVITRIKKGEPGADVRQQVMHKGDVCGLIIFDSKNRDAWQRIFATKLREDQLAAKADHAILSTTAFPRGKRELCTEDDVLVVSPARVCQVVAILRSALIKMHVRGLTLKEREDKMEQLYRFICSDEYSERLSEATKLSKQIADLDAEEVTAHQTVWKRRGRMTTRLHKVLRDVDVEVSSIIERVGKSEPVDQEAVTNLRA